VSKIDIVNASDMTKDLFDVKYSHRGQPLVVKNATNHWPAMHTFGFEFFRDLYEELGI
jgi:hypothetical protein